MKFANPRVPLLAQFRKQEQGRIRELTKWREQKYKRLKEGEKVPEITIYVFPVQLPARTRVAIYEQEFFDFKLLNGIYSDSQINVLALFPKETKAPQDYSLIKITQGTKKVLIDKHKYPYESIVVEEYETLDPLKAYEGIPYEKDVLRKVFDSAFNNEEISLSLQAVLLGSPKVMNGKGGVSLGSALDDPHYIHKLGVMMQKILPPELRTVSAQKQKKLITAWPSIKTASPFFPPESKHKFRYLTPNTLAVLQREETLRIADIGEYSYAAASLSGTNKQELYTDIANNFFRSDITTVNLGQEHTEEMSIDKIQRDNTEDVSVSIARAHLLNPVLKILPSERLAFRKNLREDIEVYQEQLGFYRGSKVHSSINANIAEKNAVRIAQSIARSRGSENVTLSDLRRARFILKTHMETFWRANDGVAKFHIRERQRTEKWIGVSSVLSNGRATMKEIWEELKECKIFDNIEDLQRYLDQRENAGQIWQWRPSLYQLTN